MVVLWFFNDPYKVTVILHVFELSLESTTVTRPSIEYVPIPAIPMPVVLPREDLTQKPNSKPVIKPIDAQSESPVERPVATHEPHDSPYEIPATPEPTKSLTVVEDNPPAVVADPHPTVVADPPSFIPPPAPSTLDCDDGIQLKGLDSIIAEPPTLDRGDDIQFEGMDNIVGGSGVGTASASGSSKETPPKSGQGFSRWLPTLCEIKLRMEQSTNGGIERHSYLDQVRMSCCSPEKEPYPSLPHIT